MSSTHIIQLAAMLLCLIGSAFFSASETAFSTFHRIRVKNMALAGHKRAQKVLAISENYDKFLSTVLIGNNIVNILLTTLSTLLFVDLFTNGAAISTVVITVTVLIFGEIMPKSLAKIKADNFALTVAPMIRFLMVILTPFSFFFSFFSRLGKADKDAMTEEELITIVDEAEQDGGLNQNEGDLIRSAIEFGDGTAEDILTPRVDVIAIDLEASFAEVAELFRSSGYSRLPVYEESLDNTVGVLHEKDYYALYGTEDPDWHTALSKPVFVTLRTPISKLMQTFQAQKCHLAVVLDEQGGMMGIVTLEDVIEELIGDVWDEHDVVVEEFTAAQDGSYTVLGSAKLEDFFAKFGIEPTEEEWEELPQTVNGWLSILFEGIPEAGMETDALDLHIRVLSTDGQKVEEVSAKPLSKAE